MLTLGAIVTNQIHLSSVRHSPITHITGIGYYIIVIIHYW